MENKCMAIGLWLLRRCNMDGLSGSSEVINKWCWSF